LAHLRSRWADLTQLTLYERGDPVNRPYLKHPLIVAVLILGCWLSLLLPAYHVAQQHQDYDTAEAVLDYSKYLIVALALSGICLIPIIISGAYLLLKRQISFTSIDRYILFITYLPTFGLTTFNLYIAADGLSNFLIFIVPATSHLLLLGYLTLGFPRKTLTSPRLTPPCASPAPRMPWP
jgi:hypothetical protein